MGIRDAATVHDHALTEAFRQGVGDAGHSTNEYSVLVTLNDDVLEDTVVVGIFAALDLARAAVSAGVPGYAIVILPLRAQEDDDIVEAEIVEEN